LFASKSSVYVLGDVPGCLRKIQAISRGWHYLVNMIGHGENGTDIEGQHYTFSEIANALKSQIHWFSGNVTSLSNNPFLSRFKAAWDRESITDLTDSFKSDINGWLLHFLTLFDRFQVE
jgi:hypothetical protein